MQPLQSVFFKCFLHFFHIPIFGRLMRRVWQQPDILCSKRVHLHHDHFIYNPLFTNLPIILPNPLFINHPISLSNPLCTNKSINLSNPFIHQYFFLIHYPNIIVLAFFPIHYPIIILSLFPRYYPISSNHSFQYSLITQPFTAIKSIIHQLYSHSVPSNTKFTNCTTIQCHPIHYSPIVQPFSAIQYTIHQLYNHSVPHCPTTDSTYSTTSNSYLLMLHPIQ